jgi:hypothetical protein
LTPDQWERVKAMAARAIIERLVHDDLRNDIAAATREVLERYVDEGRIVVGSGLGGRMDDPMVRASMTPVRVVYRNHRGEVAFRSIVPKGMWFGATEWHPEPQWLLSAWDVEKEADRDFAMSGLVWWEPTYGDRPLPDEAAS